MFDFLSDLFNVKKRKKNKSLKTKILDKHLLLIETLEDRLTPAAFTVGNLAVLRADSNTANNTTASIIELAPNTAAQTPTNIIAIDGAGANALRFSGSATSTGYLANSDDGSLLAFPAHNTATTTGNINTQLARGVGTLDASGSFTLAATYTGVSGNQARGATTLDNSSFFIADQGGVHTNGSTSPSPSGNLRAAKSFGGVVYVGQASGSLAPVSTISAPTGGTITALPGLPTVGSNAQDFYLIRSGDNGAAYDVLYIAFASSNTAGTISKYSFIDTDSDSVLDSWTTNGSYTTTFGGFGLAAADSGDGANLYVSTGQGALSGNNVLKIADDAGYNATINITTANNVVLYSAPTGTTVKGVAFAPVATSVAPTITSTNSTSFTVGSPGSFTVTATGTPTPTFSLSGSLPTGVTFNTTTGVLSGTPAAGTAATYNVTITATNGVNPDATQNFTLTVAAGASAPTFTSPNNTTFTTGSAGSFNVTASGSPSATFSTTGTLPSGVTLSAGGVLSGTPAAGTGGTYAFTITATNGINPDATQSFTLTVNQAPAITSATSTNFLVGSAGSFAVTATGFPTSFTYGVTGSLPAGVTLNTSTGVLSGTPDAGTSGAYPITLTASNGVGSAASQSFTLRVFSTVSYPTAGSTITQDFDTLPTSSSNATPLTPLAGNGPFELSGAPFSGSALSGWLASKYSGTGANLVARIDDGTTSGGAFIDYGSLDSTDRAIGSVGSSTTISRFGAILRNDTGAPLNEFTLTYVGEQWRGGGNASPVANTLNFGYQFGASDINTGTFLPSTALNFSSINLATTATSYDGNAPENRTAKTATISGFNWAPGQTLVIRWDDVDDSGQDDGLAIDDFTFAAVALAPSAPIITSAASAQFIHNVASTFNVTASGVPAVSYSATGLPAWLTLNSTTGVLSGTPPLVSTPTAINLVITVTNGVGTDATQNFTLNVVPTTISYTTAGASYAQNFDGMPSTGAYTLSGTGPLSLQSSPINSTNLHGWSIADTTGQPLKFTVDNGGSNTGSTFSYGTTGASDRALGSLASASIIPSVGAVFVNDTGATLDQISLSYIGEQWRRGNGTSNRLSFSYQVGGASVVGGLYTSVPALDFVSASSTVVEDTPLDGNAPLYRSAIANTITGLNWAPGQSLVIRWTEANDGGNDDGLAIDDLTFSASVATPAAPTITSADRFNVLSASAVSFTIAANGSPAATFSATGLPGWLSLNATTGVLSGTAPGVTAETSIVLNVTATNGVGADATQTLTVHVVPTALPYGSIGGTYTQNFDGLPKTGAFHLTGAGPVNASLNPIQANDLAGWYLARPAGTGNNAGFAQSDGSLVDGAAYSYGDVADTDRAFGLLATQGRVSSLGVAFANNTNVSLTNFTVSFAGEQWRRGDSAANTLAFSYSTSAADILSGSYTPVTGLDFTSPHTGASVTALDGNLPANQTVVTFTVTGLSWDAGTTLFLRWEDTDDTGADDGLALDNFVFSAADDATIAPTLTPATGSLAYLENEGAKVIDNTFVVSDDGADLADATIVISAGYVNGQDALGFTDQNGIAGTFNAATGTLTLTGTATLADYQTALRIITYSNSSENPATAARTVTFTVSDGAASSALATRTINVTAVNDAPVVTTSSGDTTFTSGAIAIDALLTAADVDSVNFTGANVSITANFVTGQDVLAFANTANITGSYNASTGVLTLTGTDTVANYQTALRAVTYNNTSGAPSTSPRTVSFQVNDGGAANNLSNFATKVVALNVASSQPIFVSSIAPTTTGVTVNLNRAANPVLINLYDQGGALGAADVTLVGANTGAVRGSLVFNAGNTSFTFIRTGPTNTAGAGAANGILAPDTYTLTLRSHVTNGFVDLDGNALRDIGGTNAGDYVNTFTIGTLATGTVIASIPDVARGFGQAVNVPNTSTGLPVILSNGNNVGGVDLTVNYDPALLTITGFATTIPGATAGISFPSPGVALIQVSSGAAFATVDGALTLGTFTATVPVSAPYASKQIIRITKLAIVDASAGVNPIPAIADDAVHVASLFGDLNGSQTYSSADTILIQRLGLGTNSGVTAFQTADPLIVGDINYSNSFTSADTIFVQRLGLGVAVANVPSIPVGSTPVGGPDPIIFIPTDLAAAAGASFTIPVNVTVTEPSGISIAGIDFVMTYDATKVTIAPTGAVTTGTMLSGANVTSPFSFGYSIPTPGTIRIQGSTGGTSITFANGTTGNVFNIAATVNAGATSGPTKFNILASDGTITTGILDNDVNDLVLLPAPTNGNSDSVDGTLTIAGAGNAVPTVTPATGTLAYTENAGAVVLDNTFVVADSDTANLASATLTFTAGYVNGQDVLAFTDANGITGNFNAGTGVLTLTGASSVANYQAALRSITYANSSDSPSTTARSLSIVVNDGTDPSVAVTRTINVTAVNDAPAGTDTTVSGVQSTDYTFTTANFGFTDPSDTPANTLLAVQITTLPALGSLTNNGVAVTAGQSIPVADITGGLLKFTPAGSATGAPYTTFTFRVQDNGGVVNGGVDLDPTPNNMTINVNAPAQILAVGDIAILGYRADAPDTYAFVTWVDLNPGTSINFWDSGYDGGGDGTGIGSGGGNWINSENIATWTNTTGSVIPAGTVVVLQDASGGTVDLGTVVGNLSGLSASGDQIFAGQGSFAGASPSTWNGTLIFGFDFGGAAGWDASASSSNTSALPSVLNTAAGNIAFAHLDNGQYNGSRTFASIAAAQAAVRDTANYVFDDAGAGATVSSTDFAFVANTAPAVTPATGTLSYTENAGAVVLDDTFVVADDGANLAGATLSFTAGFVTGQDVLGFTDQNGIVGSFNAGTGVLTLTGSATLAQYQTALRSITYANGSDAPSTTARTLSLVVSDGSLSSIAVTRTVNVTAVNDAPAGTNGAVTTNEDADYTFAAGDFGFTDPNDSPANTLAAVTITTLPSLGTLTNNGVAVTAGQSIPVADIAGGLLKFTPVANANGSPYTAFTFQVQDNGAGTNIDLSPNTLTVNVTAVNDAPVVAATGGAAAFVAGGSAVAVDAGVSLVDIDSPNLAGATVSITANFASGQDQLLFTNQNGIAGSYNASTGVLTLSGSATLAQYQTALRSVTYNNTSGTPSLLTRTVSFQVNDGALPSNIATRNVTVSPVAGANVQVIDNGAAGYANSGAAWTSFGLHGFQGDIHYAAPGSGSSTSTWTFAVTPGIYRVAATWPAEANRASNAPFAVLDGTTTVGTAVINQKLAPNDFNADGASWEYLGASSHSITGTMLAVALANNANGFVIADAVRIERIADLPVGSEIEVALEGNEVASGGSANFGTANVGTALLKTFTVRNLGVSDLTLTGPINVPAGFSVVAPFGSTTVAPGASTTFTLQLDAGTIGAPSGVVTFGSNDSDEATYAINVSGTVQAIPAVQVIDNTTAPGAGFSTTAGWTYLATQGFQGDVHYAPAGTGDRIATWTFPVTPGLFQVSATWNAEGNRASNSPFTVFDGATNLGTTTLNQKIAPNDFGVWENLAATPFVITGTTLTVTLNNNADGFVIADGIRIEKVGEFGAGAKVGLTQGTTTIASASVFGVGSTYVGTPISKTFTVTNNGSQTLNITSPLTVPTGFTVTSTFGSTSLAPGASTTVTVEMSAAALGTFSGAASFTSNDSASPFSFTLSGSILANPVAAVQKIDNSDAGFATLGSGWTLYGGQGVNNSVVYHAKGTGSNSAEWTFFTEPGVYQVSVTYKHEGNRATNAPFTVRDNTTPIRTEIVNQKLAPNDFTELGAKWKNLPGTFTLVGNKLVVSLSDNANGFVIADSVRIEKVG